MNVFPRGRLNELTTEKWALGEEDFKQRVARMASTAAWGLGKLISDVIKHFTSYTQHWLLVFVSIISWVCFRFIVASLSVMIILIIK